MICDCCGREITELPHTCLYDRRMDLSICPLCGENILDGYCGCDFVPDWSLILEIARHDYETHAHDQQFGSFTDFLRWKDFPQEIIDQAALLSGCD